MRKAPRMSLSALALYRPTAVDLMTPNPVSIDEHASVHEAAALLTDRGISAVPVIDEAGRPLGVLSRADIVRHDREGPEYLARPPRRSERAQFRRRAGGSFDGFQVETVESTEVRDIMTPIVFAVAPRAADTEVVREMLDRKVHRLFVIDDDGILVGVISALDVLARLYEGS